MPEKQPAEIATNWRPESSGTSLRIGCLVFEAMDQIDFTAPFEVFSRVPNATVDIIAASLAPIRDVKGLVITPTRTIAETGALDVLSVAGGLGQQNLMEDAAILDLIRRQAASAGLLFSVCTGALLCGAAGVLQGRKATSHWSVLDLLHYYGADEIQARVVADGNYVSCAGVTAGLDGALFVASLLRGQSAAEEIQLEIEYAPAPLFHSGTPDSAPPGVVDAYRSRYGVHHENRERTAKRYADAHGAR